MADLLAGLEPPPAAREEIGPGALLLRGWALPRVDTLLAGVVEVAAQAPFRHMVTPGGFQMSVAMTNCGQAGWVTDRGGYRYAANDPATDRPWPALPPAFSDLAGAAAHEAGYPGFAPDACLINRYEPGARLTLHQDKDERYQGHPIVSVSLGLPAVFQFGGLKRADPIRRVSLAHGDVVVWGGPSRLFHHGILPLKEGLHPQLGATRINLTLRRAL
ncbi:DNA oxidative demethylase AlkB [Azospirillum sp. B4]|uniref:DNA oxidative demethylase AlkB n=1 Tax=Azospirillum sp. B4 TaxID=95605 RepID=UPI00034CA96A|nr:DNA oxidative demethylase AlkB [Azospirillum sp. B4]